MYKSANVLTVCLLIVISGCTDRHLINNKVYLSEVENAFAEREKLAGNRKNELFSVFQNKLSSEQIEALKFIIAYSPINDLADYNGDFFLANADLALRVRKETPWGKSIPEDIFLHYVLPFRVNNENLDSFRIVFYDELKNRIKGLKAEDASLEINHWCHEKVSYLPADNRTSAPLSTILSARGRCGEESTFTVAALRTAGIPARQVYTPRWAHSDDNHAWVEVWINGKWFYMGACEPEPVLDRGWFTEPARRAMLIHTKSFGAFTGNENAVKSTRNFTEINNLSKYALTKEIFIKVLDSENRPAEGAIVEYQLYNYAEFYPLATVPADKNGISRFKTGLGDLLIWARKDGAFNFKKISVNEVDTVLITMNREPAGTDSFDFDLAVPVARTPFKGPDAGLIAENNKRITAENILRQKYIDTWMKPDEASALAGKTGTDDIIIKDLISRSMGNYKNIAAFLESADPGQKQLSLALLSVIADKDLRDISTGVLSDHLNNVVPLTGSEKKISTDIYNKYILNPRIANEIIAPWRGYLFKNLPEKLKSEGAKDPGVIINYLDENIKLADNENYYKTPITPRGVLELKVSDSFSRDICFVAVCRTLGIPSRLEPGTNLPQYFSDNRWNDVFFSDYARPSSGKGYIRLVTEEKNPVPEYYTHFTLARFENGRYNTLEYENNKRVTDFKDELSLAPGHYMIVTGNRLNDSRILSTISFFQLKENEHKLLNVKIKKDISPREVLGRLDLKTKFFLSDNRPVAIDTLMAKGIVMLWIEPDKEPTKHIFNDLPLLKTELDNWGGYFIFLTDQNGNDNILNFKALKGLPEKSLSGTDKGSVILRGLSENTPVTDLRLPYIILADKAGNIIFRSEGYRIGIGEQILKKVR
jgi:transglutaminase-like putative cysteine protease